MEISNYPKTDPEFLGITKMHFSPQFCVLRNIPAEYDNTAFLTTKNYVLCYKCFEFPKELFFDTTKCTKSVVQNHHKRKCCNSLQFTFQR